jgi:8-oxo-dGTP pyrophosphatase MutT (NUDIX family)
MEGDGRGEPNDKIPGAAGPASLLAGLTRERLKTLLDARLGFEGLSERAEVRLPGSEDAGVPVDLSDAAVLIPIVGRVAGLQVVLTRRPDYLRRHAGQVAFPGGRIDPGDEGPVQAALREADEEIGLAPPLVDVRGALAPFATGTGFKIFPIVGLVEARFSARINQSEVAEAFEVPFAFLMNPANHARKTGEFRGVSRSYYEMIYDGRRIWGATAHMIVKLYQRLFASP